MKSLANKAFLIVSLPIAASSFMLGLFSYNLISSLMPGNYFYTSIEEHWRLSLINAGFFSLTSVLILLYIQLKETPSLTPRNWILSGLKIAVLTTSVYLLGIFLIWTIHFFNILKSPAPKGLAMTSASELNIYWGAILLSTFWFFLVLRTKQLNNKANQNQP